MGIIVESVVVLMLRGLPCERYSLRLWLQVGSGPRRQSPYKCDHQLIKQSEKYRDSFIHEGDREDLVGVLQVKCCEYYTYLIGVSYCH